MKHTLLFFFVFLICLQVLPAQVITISPAQTKKAFTTDLSDPYLDLEVYATIKNVSADTIHLKWSRLELDRPSSWQTQVCDGITCYEPFVSTNIDPQYQLNDPVTLKPNESREFILHVLPGGTPGTGLIDIDFFLTNKPTERLGTMSFVVEVQALVTSSYTPRVIDVIRVFPNPADDYFQLTDYRGVDRLVIYNILGIPVRQFLVGPGQRYSIGNLPDGMYLVSLINNQKGALKTIRLSKRGLRP
ncbi:MAG: T9SS type A sorting domain-containing protein [Lewinellaceae bacterium]|nr:T9SS type A sorting domain-containing protein [Lewinellaceae bacterium]